MTGYYNLRYEVRETPWAWVYDVILDYPEHKISVTVNNEAVWVQMTDPESPGNMGTAKLRPIGFDPKNSVTATRNDELQRLRVVIAKSRRGDSRTIDVVTPVAGQDEPTA